jgi:hypothetical protein
MARKAVARLHDALVGGEGEDRPRHMDSNSTKDRATADLAVHLLISCVDPSDLANELARIDECLADRMADRLLDGVDFDHFEWSGRQWSELQRCSVL